MLLTKKQVVIYADSNSKTDMPLQTTNGKKYCNLNIYFFLAQRTMKVLI